LKEFPTKENEGTVLPTTMEVKLKRRLLQGGNPVSKISLFSMMLGEILNMLSPNQARLTQFFAEAPSQ